MPGFKGTPCTMPQFKGMKGGPKELPNLPFDGDISHSSSHKPALTPNAKSMGEHRSKAKTGTKKHEG